MITTKQNFSLINNNTFRIDKCAKVYVEYETETDLVDYVKSGALKDGKYIFIGEGSNLLLTQDFDGVVVRSLNKEISVVAENNKEIFVKAGAGLHFDDLIAYCVEKGFAGIENLSLIAGTVGASAVQNVGAYGVEAGDRIHSVRMVDVESGEVVEAGKSECEFGYRMSRFKKDWANRYAVVSVTYRLDKNPEFVLSYGGLSKMMEGKEITLQSVRDCVIAVRKDKLPAVEEYGSAGSFFKNPIVSKERYDKVVKVLRDACDESAVPMYEVSDSEVKIPAGWLIEKCGWKGQRRGEVGVWHKQALILVNYGNGDGKDVQDLAKSIQTDVWDKFGIELSPEVIMI